MSKWLEKQRIREEQEAQIVSIGTVFADDEPPQRVEDPPQSNTRQVYTFLEGDQPTLVAKRLGLSYTELMEHNGWPKDVQPGFVFHLPFQLKSTESLEPRIELLHESLPMHVKKPDGCKKWSFGNMKSWDDAKSSGFFPRNTNVTVLAIAHVPLKEGNKLTEAAYYLDANALGDYETTGRLRWSTGYMWSDLAEGHIDPAEARAERMEKDKAERLAKKSMDVAATSKYLEGYDSSFIEKRLVDTLRAGDANLYKRSYQLLPQRTTCTADIPDNDGQLDQQGRRFVYVKDFDTRRPDRKLYNNQEVTLDGTFEYDGVTYSRPLAAAENGYWFGIDNNYLISNDHLYNTNIDAMTRSGMGNALTTTERYLWVPLAKFFAHPYFAERRDRKNKNNNMRV